MELREIFKRLGHPKHANTVYAVLIKSKEPLLVSDVAKQCRLPRMTVYRALDSLKSGKLISETRIGRRTFYVAESAHKLSEAMQLTEQQSAEVVARHSKAREKDVPHSVRFLRGPDGIRAAFDDVVEHAKKGETFFRYTSERDLKKVNSYLARDYRERRDKKKLERQVISNAVSGSQKKSRLERFIRFIPAEADQFQQNIIELIYGERVSIIDLNEETVMIIENKQLAEFQKVIFKLLYKRLDR